MIRQLEDLLETIGFFVFMIFLLSIGVVALDIDNYDPFSSFLCGVFYIIPCLYIMLYRLYEDLSNMRFENLVNRYLQWGWSNGIAKLFNDADLGDEKVILSKLNQYINLDYPDEIPWLIGKEIRIKYPNPPKLEARRSRGKLRMIAKYGIDDERELVVRLLLETLGDKYESLEVKEKVFSLLLEIGIQDATVSTEPMVDWLIDALVVDYREYDPVRDKCCDILGEIGGEKAGDALITILASCKDDPDAWHFRKSLVETLLKIDAGYAVSPMVKTIQEGKPKPFDEERERIHLIASAYASLAKDWEPVSRTDIKCWCGRDGSRCRKCKQTRCRWHGCECTEHSD